MSQTHQTITVQNEVSIEVRRIADVDMSHVGVDTKALAKLFPNGSYMFIRIDDRHVITALLEATNPNLILQDIKDAAQAVRPGDVDLDKPVAGATGYLDPMLEYLRKAPSVCGDAERKWLSEMPFAHGAFVVDLWDTLFQLDQNYTQLLRSIDDIRARLHKNPKEAQHRIEFILRECRSLSTWKAEEARLAVLAKRKIDFRQELYEIMQREASRFSHATWVQYFVVTLASLGLADLVRQQHAALDEAQRRDRGAPRKEYWDSQIYENPYKKGFVRNVRAKRDQWDRWSVGTNEKVIRSYKARHQHAQR
jgi:hypothetical protein